MFETYCLHNRYNIYIYTRQESTHNFTVYMNIIKLINSNKNNF